MEKKRKLSKMTIRGSWRVGSRPLLPSFLSFFIVSLLSLSSLLSRLVSSALFFLFLVVLLLLYFVLEIQKVNCKTQGMFLLLILVSSKRQVPIIFLYNKFLLHLLLFLCASFLLIFSYLLTQGISL